MKKIGFKPRADVVMIEIGKKKAEKTLIHLPDTAKKKNADDVLLTVVAVGESVKNFKPGDVVMHAPSTNTFNLDVGDGSKTYCFVREEEVFGTFVAG